MGITCMIMSRVDCALQNNIALLKQCNFCRDPLVFDGRERAVVSSRDENILSREESTGRDSHILTRRNGTLVPYPPHTDRMRRDPDPVFQKLTEWDGTLFLHPWWTVNVLSSSWQ